VISEECDLTKRPSEIPAWDDEAKDLKPVLARQMEVYAGYFEFTDHHIGRLIDALEQLQVLDETLIFFVIGDNGASGEGTLQGTFNEVIPLDGLNAFESAAFMAARIDKFGGLESYDRYAVGWAHAMDPECGGQHFPRSCSCDETSDAGMKGGLTNNARDSHGGQRVYGKRSTCGDRDGHQGRSGPSHLCEHRLNILMTRQ
jgi:hypothetical protein